MRSSRRGTIRRSRLICLLSSDAELTSASPKLSPRSFVRRLHSTWDPAEKTFEIVSLGKDVFAFVSPESKTAVVSGNSVAIVGESAVLVVDSGRFPTLARRMIAEIRRRTKKPSSARTRRQGEFADENAVSPD